MSEYYGPSDAHGDSTQEYANSPTKKIKTDCLNADCLDNEFTLGKYVVNILSSDSIYYLVQIFALNLYKEQNGEQYNNLKLYIVDHENDKIKYVLYENASINIIFDNHLITISNNVVSSDHGLSYKIECLYNLKIYADSYEILEKFIKKASKHRRKLEIFKYFNGKWYCSGVVQHREASTLILDDDVINNMINDVKKFEESAQDYKKYGIPYKRNYMFYGPPGTGKTSLANILANVSKRSLYIMSFDSNMNDSEFYRAIRDIHNKKSILLLEDIDCIFKDRNNESKTNVSFSALFNILDGINYNENMMTILTTNYIEKLEKALTRPGRIDQMVPFSTIYEKQISNLLNLYNVKLGKKCLENIILVCINNNLVASTLSLFLFTNRNEKYEDIVFLEKFKLYVKEHVNFVDCNKSIYS